MNTLALTVWNGTISPLFDSASTLSIVQTEGTTETIDLSNKTLFDKIGFLKSLDAPVLICGAISDFSMSLLSQHAIPVIPWIRGPVHDVIMAYKSGDLISMRCYCLPGCGFHRHGKGHGRGTNGVRCPNNSHQPGAKT